MGKLGVIFRVRPCLPLLRMSLSPESGTYPGREKNEPVN